MRKITLTILAIALLITAAQAQQGLKQQQKRFVFMTSLGFSSGFGQINLPNNTRTVENWKVVSNKNTNIMLHQLMGYQFNNYFYMGVGAGMDIWKRTAFIPLYLNLSVNMIDRKISPTLYLNMGYGFKWYMEAAPEPVDHVIHGSTAGPMGEAGLGLNIRINSRISILISGVYKAQLTSIRYTSHPENMDYASMLTDDLKNQLYHFAGFRVGIMY